MKKGKKIKVDLNKNYSTNFGCIDNSISKAIYINLSTWCEPLSINETNYNRIIRNLNWKIKNSIHNYLLLNIKFDLINKNRTIVNLDIKESGIKYGKKSFCDLEITLFLNNFIGIESKSLRYELNNITSLIIKDVFETNNNFKFYKTKN